MNQSNHAGSVHQILPVAFTPQFFYYFPRSNGLFWHILPIHLNVHSSNIDQVAPIKYVHEHWQRKQASSFNTMRPLNRKVAITAVDYANSWRA